MSERNQVAKKTKEVAALCKELQEKLGWSSTKKMVLGGTINGVSNNEIAKILKLSKRNIRRHRKSLYEFFDCSNHSKLLDKVREHLAK